MNRIIRELDTLMARTENLRNDTNNTELIVILRDTMSIIKEIFVGLNRAESNVNKLMKPH